MHPTFQAPHIGEPVKRKEDYRFLTGAGQYTDDIALAAQAHAVFVRSPHAHALVRSVSTDAARAAPGVIGVLTGADVAADKINGLPCGWLITSTNGEPMKEPPHPILALDTVRYVGDQVAMVVAETLEQARDAAELVEVDYDPLPAVVLVADAAAGSVPGAVVHDIAPTTTATNGPSATRPPWMPCSPVPPTSPSWTWSTTAWFPTPWSRARPSAATAAPMTSTRCTWPTRTRTSSGC